MAFDKKDYQKIYKTEEMGKVLAHIRGMKDHEFMDITGDLFAEYPDDMNENAHHIVFHKTAKKKYITVLWIDHFEVIDVSRAFSGVGPMELEECVSLFVDSPEAIEDLTDLMD